MKDIRPSLALYNSLLPFLVAVVEHYFRELFTVLIEYDPYARDRIRELKLNTLKEFNTVADAMQIQEGSLKVEVLIAKGYNFQNIEMVNSCYNKFLRIDIKKILSAKKRIGSRNVQMLEQLQELIERRHWMIHHFDFITDIDKEKYLYYLSFTNYLIDMLTMEIEKLKGYNILSHSTYSNTTGQF